MAVDAPESHGTDAGPQRQILRPGFRAAQQAKRWRLAIEQGVGLLPSRVGRQQAVLQGQGGVDQPGGSGGGLGVPDVGFDGA